MLRPVSKEARDPFEGLQLPVSAWKALEEADITSLEQLQAMAPVLEQIACIRPEVARVIKDKLDRLAGKRTVRVRLAFLKRAD